MSDKELAVQLYIARMQSFATIASSPNYSGNAVELPSYKEMVDGVNELISYLSSNTIG